MGSSRASREARLVYASVGIEAEFYARCQQVSIHLFMADWRVTVDGHCEYRVLEYPVPSTRGTLPEIRSTSLPRKAS